MKQLDITPYIRFKTSRSSGSGGQHVNKVETKVTLLLDLNTEELFTAEEKVRIRTRLASRLLADDTIQITVQDSRSQLRNKEIAINKLEEILQFALKTEKPRKATKPSKAAVNARLDAKRKQALRKINRRKDWE